MSPEEGPPSHFPAALGGPLPPTHQPLGSAILFPKSQFNRCLLSNWKAAEFLREHGNQTACLISTKCSYPLLHFAPS